MARTQSDVKECKDLCGNEKMKAKKDVHKDNTSTASVNYDRILNLDHKNVKMLYCNSMVASCDCNVIARCDFECNYKPIRKEDFENSKATIREKTPLSDKRRTNYFDDVTEVLDSVDSTYEKVCRMKHEEKSIDSGVSLTSVNAEDNDYQIIIDNHVGAQRKAVEKSDTTTCKNAENVAKDCHRQNVISHINNINNILQKESDIGNTAASAIGFNHCCNNVNNSEDYFEGNVNLAKDTEENIEHTSSIENIKEGSIEKTIAEIREMNETIKKVLCTSNDEQQNLTEERMVESLTAKMENDHDEVMKKIIESCTNVSTDFQEEPANDENLNADLKESSEFLNVFRDSKILPRHSILETDIAKEDILKTIEEAKKILTDSPYWNMSEANAESYDKDDSSEKFMRALKNDEKCKKINEEENSFVENEDTKMNPINIENEEAFFLNPDVVESNLQRLTELTCLDRPMSHFEIHETLEKIAEEKRKIKDQKKESLETLSKKFDEIDKFVADHDDSFCASDKDHCGLKALDDTASDFDSLDEFQVDLKNLELPLTKSEITENLKIEELEKELVDEIERHKKLMDEYQSIIAADLETTSEAIVESAQANHEDIKQSENESKKDEEVEMTEELIRKHCKEHKLYQTPHLNDVLYLHYKGRFSFIENLEKYTGLKCLWLENNGIREIANLENQSELKCLYLHHNLINKIENLDWLTKLDTLNLSHNTIRRIENLDGLKFLNNLNLSHNYLQETADIEYLRLLHAVSILDISHNRIDNCDVVDILRDMKSLRVVTLTGNPVLKQIKMYRKTMILKCKNLQYLDDRPVFPRDRACAEAWMRGGADEEVAERNRWIQAEQKRIDDSITALINKRKLRKPVGTSKKEAVDKKKEKEEKNEVDKEEEEQDEEIATKSSARTARSSGLDHLIIHYLDLERKKKSKERSFLGSCASSSLSSSDEELASNEEKEDARQKGSEESDGRRPMAEEERRVTNRHGGELLLPWKAEAREETRSQILIEEMSEPQQYTAGERKYLGKRILDNRRSIDDPITREIADCNKIMLELTMKEEEASNLRNSIDDNNRIYDREREKTSISVSCDTSDLRQMLEEDEKVGTSAVADAREHGSEKNIKSYRRKNKECPFGSKLSSIREEMREFCDGMNRFVDENKIAFKNGEVEGFWGGRKMVDANLQTDSVDDDENREIEAEVPAGEEDKLQRWSTKERKLKVREMINEREAEAQKNTMETKDLLAEMRYQNKTRKMYKSNVSNKLMVLEKKLDSEKSVIDDTKRESLISVTTDHDSEEQFSKSKNIAETNAISLQEESQIVGSNQESPEVLKLQNNYDKFTTTIKHENINDTVENFLDKTEENLSNSEQEFSTELDSQVKSFIQTIDRLSLERTSQPSKLMGKRTREAEDIEISNKKSFFIEEVNPGRKLDERKPRSQISERCRQHLIQETRKFAKKVSPLIDKCITNLIKDTENTNQKSQYQKYDRRSLGEYLPSDFASRMDFGKPTGNFGGQNNHRDKCADKSNDLTNMHSEKQESTREETIKLESAVADKSDIQSLADLLQQYESTYKSESSAANTGMSLYKEFCDHLDQLKNKKKLLIKPDFMNQEDKEKLPDNEILQETECSIKKSVRPLIEVISESPAISEDSEDISKQKEVVEKSHNPQNTSDNYQKDAVFRRLSEEMIDISDVPEKHINQENLVSLDEKIKLGMFSTSGTSENSDCKEECALKKEKDGTITTNMKKSIEMQVAQEG
ncbi:Leucine-rich repeat-containing protein 50-like protein [Ooceraea biroi]|uniref:Dynein axonemal assembly factor 1 homolog n=1 Tax=Ooceraea biroi TaxID=2015173 RepID=A0A026WZI9_OOCBI|nr:Leucine-rich repeat-containing protein 50-like protein [Ooceraea biroi]